MSKKKKTEPVAFKINQPELSHWAATKLHFVRRDLDAFKKFGVTEEKLASMEEILREYEEFPTDEEILGDQIICTQAREDLAKTLRIEMTAMLTRARDKFGIRSAHYRRFGTARMSALYGMELLLAAEKVLRLAGMYQNELADEGLTPEILTDFARLVDDYREAVGAQEDTASDRIIATQERVKRANKLYNAIVRLCNKGKRIWENTSEARYNDYVIYKNQPKKKKAGQVTAEVESIHAEAEMEPEKESRNREQPVPPSDAVYHNPVTIDTSTLEDKEPGEGLLNADAG